MNVMMNTAQHTLDNMTGRELNPEDTRLVFTQHGEFLPFLLSFLHLLGHEHLSLRQLLDLLLQVLVHSLDLVKTQLEEVIINVLIGRVHVCRGKYNGIVWTNVVNYWVRLGGVWLISLTAGLVPHIGNVQC